MESTVHERKISRVPPSFQKIQSDNILIMDLTEVRTAVLFMVAVSHVQMKRRELWDRFYCFRQEKRFTVIVECHRTSARDIADFDFWS